MSGPVRYWEDLEVGQEFVLGSRTFTEKEIVGFAEEWDPQPFHIDPELAQRSEFGGLIASGFHTAATAMRLMVDHWLNPVTGMGSPGIDELRWLRPVRPGDTIEVKLRVLDKRASQSRSNMGLTVLGWTAINQHGDTVMTLKAVNLIRRKPVEKATVGGAPARRAVRGIDHAVVVVPDLAAACKRYGELGFALQPQGRHVKLGTANHLMIFEHNYLELIGVVEPTPYNEERRLWLKQGGGLANIALATDGADIARDAFVRAGLNPDPILEFGRAVEIDGRMEEAKFRTVRVPKNSRPIVGLFVCDHLTPQFVYRAEWSRHPNGVRGLAGITVLAADPARVTALCTRFFGTGAARPEGDHGLVVDTGTQPIHYMTRAVFGKRYPGIAPARTDDHAALLSFAVEDIERVHSLLGTAVPHQRTADGRILVGANEACGVAIEFVPA